MTLENKLQGLFKKLYKSVLAMAVAMPISCGGKPNNAPIITSNPKVGEVYEGATFQYDVNATDLDKDSLMYTLVTAPAGATIDNSTGLITWATSFKGTGKDYISNFTVMVYDNKGGSADQNFVINVKGVNLADYFYLPRRNLYIAKRPVVQGINWYEAHEEVHKRGARMITLREFMELVADSEKLRDGLGNTLAKAEINNIFDLWWGDEWIDAEFEPVDGNLYIKYNHRIINDKLKPLNSEPLEDCVMEDCRIDADHIEGTNMQGMPIIKKNTHNGAPYIAPRRDKKSVAGFFNNYIKNKEEAEAVLDCNRDPMNCFRVREVREGR